MQGLPLFFLLWSFAAGLSAHVEVAIDSYIDSAMVCLVHQRYEAAEEVIRSKLLGDIRNADALYMLLTIEQTRLLDYESYTVEGRRFLGLTDSVLAVLKRDLPNQRGADSVRYLFYLGNVYGGKSLLLAKCGNWIAAAREALTSVSILKQVKELDSTFYAAYLGIGVFNYYLSQNLGWIPFMGDKAEQGLDEIELATQARLPYNYAALNSLSWILIDRGDFRRADSIISSVLREIPDNTIFLRIKTRIALWTQKYDEAIEASTHLADLSLHRNPINWSDLLSSYQVIVECNSKLGKAVESRAAAERALEFEVPGAAMKIPYVRKHIAYMKSALKQTATQ